MDGKQQREACKCWDLLKLGKMSACLFVGVSLTECLCPKFRRQSHKTFSVFRFCRWIRAINSKEFRRGSIWSANLQRSTCLYGRGNKNSCVHVWSCDMQILQIGLWFCCSRSHSIQDASCVFTVLSHFSTRAQRGNVSFWNVITVNTACLISSDVLVTSDFSLCVCLLTADSNGKSAGGKKQRLQNVFQVKTQVIQNLELIFGNHFYLTQSAVYNLCSWTLLMEPSGLGIQH